MVRIASALVAVVASSLSLVAAQSYQDFELDSTVIPTFADTVTGLFLSQGDVAAGKAACDSLDSCLGVICDSSADNCVPFAYSSGGVTDPGSAGYDSIHFKYNAESGPACRTTLDDVFTTAQGNCQCGSELTRQNTAFGCILGVTPSQLVQRRRIAANRIMPGHAARAVYERRRTHGESGNKFI
ncbi:hypothetical protein P389DRAFT_167481 [Cystobasidium minutum MCA 4210]|uniref:uncharacterized protein n=1 Tax=Cystobasidium minutum MCA 4210 TaxID=1397322 RepID=UPI0034CD212B|eukprot:jgi/Rhomi1/167481/fgenesh1_kg.2_\